MNISSLREAGLTNGEIQVYLALLEIGISTTGPIIEKSGVAKSIVYQILGKLMQKGLVSHIVKNKTKYFQASDPKKILEFIDKKNKKLQENKKKIEQLLPELLLKQTMSTKSTATIYTGFRGIQTAHNHTYDKLKKGEEYVFLGIPAYQPEDMHLFWQRDHVRRVLAGIKCRLLFNKGTEKNILKQRKSYKLLKVREMKSDIKTPATFLIYKDTVVIILQSPTAIAVEIINQEIADSFMAYFNEFWKESSK